MFVLSCSETVQMCYNAKKILLIVKTLIKVMQWSVPLIILFLGSWDLFKAVTRADDQKAVQDATKSLIRRLVAGLVVFLVPFLVRLVLGLFANQIPADGEIDSASWIDCWTYVDQENSNFFKGCKDIYKRNTDDTDNSWLNDSENSNTGNNNGSTTTTSNGSKICYVYDLYMGCTTGTLTTKTDNYYDKGGSCRLDVSSSDIHVSNGAFSDYDSMSACDTACKSKSSSKKVVGKVPKKEGVCTCIWEASKKDNLGKDAIPSFTADGTYKKYSCDDGVSCSNAFGFCRDTGTRGKTQSQ